MQILVIILVVTGIGILVSLFVILRQVFIPVKITQLNALYNQNKMLLVIKTAKKLISKEPRNHLAHYILGKAYLAGNKPDLALIELQTVNLIGRFDPQICIESEFRTIIAGLYNQFEQYEEALKEYLVLIQLEPFVADHYYNAGLLFESRNKPDTAISYYMKAIGIDRSHPGSHLQLGLIHYQQKKIIEAKAELEVALRGTSDNSRANFYLGKIKKDTHDFAGALRHFDEAQNDPLFKLKSAIEKGITYMSMNNFDKAITELQRAVSSSKNEAGNEPLYARYFLADCFEKVRNIEKAIEQWERIYEKQPAFKDVSSKLSQYQELRSDDRVKDYLTVGKEEFINICKSIVLALNLEIHDVSEIINGCQIIGVESESKWRNARKMPRLIRFYRISDMIKDSTVRAMQEEMRKINVARGVIFTSSTFSKVALEFAESRPIDLYDKDQLRDFLKKADEMEKSSAS
jgi:tetratricopeptide (TPR) repeat protein